MSKPLKATIVIFLLLFSSLPLQFCLIGPVSSVEAEKTTAVLTKMTVTVYGISTWGCKSLGAVLLLLLISIKPNEVLVNYLTVTTSNG
ncbi:hypothetical protein NQ317_018856 [Molorchus minor]|uniref:Uncharacterized protein n=1 Tax=Molorchus minor TaxID=1323400 RepID=A0ABQ9J7E9_9CUCU|nr:hypothetical protein NQ317_018856 [Molorchus minor]